MTYIHMYKPPAYILTYMQISSSSYAAVSWLSTCNAQVDPESGHNPPECGGGSGGAAAESGREGMGEAAPEAERMATGQQEGGEGEREGEGRGEDGERGRDYGKFGVGDDEGAAEGGFKGPRVAHAADASTRGVRSGLQRSPEEMGRAAARAMEEAKGCVQSGQVRARSL
jgi:hypothetical protein